MQRVGTISRYRTRKLVSIFNALAQLIKLWVGACIKKLSCSVFLLILIAPISLASSLGYYSLPSFNGYKFKSLDLKNIEKIGGHWDAVQDRYGFIWFGGAGGLARYDGYELKIYRQIQGEEKSLSNNYVTDLLVDKEGDLWIATRWGLNKYDYRTNSFLHYLGDEESTSIDHNFIWTLLEDKTGQLWVGTGAGLKLFNKKQGSFSRPFERTTYDEIIPRTAVLALLEDSAGRLWIGFDGEGVVIVNREKTDIKILRARGNETDKLSHNIISDIFEDKSGNIWVGTAKGLNRYLGNGRFKQYLHLVDDVRSISGNSIRAIADGIDGNLWIGSDDGGLSRYLQKFDSFQRLHSSERNPLGLVNNKVRSLFKDDAGNLWVGHFPAGVSMLDPYASAIKIYKHSAINQNSLSNSDILSVFEDSKNNLWVGTERGLNYIDKQAQTIKRYHHSAIDKFSLPADPVLAVFEDSYQTVWVGTWGGGLAWFNKKQGRFVSINGLDADQARVIYESRDKKYLWVGTEKGLSRLDRSNYTFKHYVHDKDDDDSLLPLGVDDIREDSDGNFWVGSDTGLNLFKREEERFVRFTHDPNNRNSLAPGYVTQIFEDSAKNIWVVMGASGISILDYDNRKFSQLNAQSGLPDDIVGGVIQDLDGGIWISTGSGICSYDPRNKIFKKHFTKEHGLPGNLFKKPAVIRNSAGELVFGSSKGLAIFNPEKMPVNNHSPKTVITNFEIFYKPVEIGSRSPLREGILEAQSLLLTHRDSVFSFSFSALDYLMPLKNQYAYKLEGFDEDWVYGRQDRIASYTSLKAGKYTFKVKGSNSDGVWDSDGDSIDITILPPPWKTWWAYCIYFLLFIALLGWFVYTQRQKVWYEREKLKREMEVVSRLKQLDKLKDNFLANTSHELRTPLFGIIGLAETMLESSSENLSENHVAHLKMIAKSGHRLGRLVNDILDFSNVQNSAIELDLQPVSMYEVSEIVLNLSSYQIDTKQLELINNVKENLPPVYADADRLQQILFNLVSNAIKFTPSGFVSVTAKKQGTKLMVSVTDSGVGIEQDKLDSIFNLFEQAEDSDTRGNEGLGLGLALTKRLVELQSGEMQVSTQVGAGSSFTFSLPLASDELEDKSIKTKTALHSNTASAELPFIDKLELGEHNLVENDSPSAKTEKNIKSQFPESNNSEYPRILIVDDDAINRQILISCLGDEGFELSTAEDGRDALGLIETRAPFDLILLDIMMPRMSGYEVCEKVREIYPAQDLPILFLTAKNMITDITRGFSVGGNDFIHKPVSKEELVSRIKLHLQLLYVNRDMERQVAERTESLKKEHERLKKTQSQLVQSEKMAGMGTLVAGMAHEFCNPLNFSSVAVYNLENAIDELLGCYDNYIKTAIDDELAEEFREYFQELAKPIAAISDGNLRIKKLVDDLQTFSCGDETNIEVRGLKACLDSTVNLIKNNYENHVDFLVEGSDNIDIECHVSSLNLSFLNILANAAQAIQDKADQLPEFERGLVNISIVDLGGTAEVKISDNGVGIAPDMLSKVCDPFFTTRAVGAGAGLGLSSAYGVIEREGGSLNIQSELGKGTVITINLPIVVWGGDSAVEDEQPNL